MLEAFSEKYHLKTLCLFKSIIFIRYIKKNVNYIYKHIISNTEKWNITVNITAYLTYLQTFELHNQVFHVSFFFSMHKLKVMLWWCDVVMCCLVCLSHACAVGACPLRCSPWTTSSPVWSSSPRTGPRTRATPASPTSTPPPEQDPPHPPQNNRRSDI